MHVRSRWKTWGLSLTVALLGVGTMPAFVLENLGLPPGAVAAAQPSPATDRSPFQDHMAEAGVTSCSTNFPAMGALLTENSQYMIQTLWNKQDANKHVLRAVVGMQVDTLQHAGPAVGILIGAPMAADCETNAIRVTPLPMTCDAVRRQFLGDGTMVARLEGLPVYTVADGDQVITVPIGENCVAVTISYAAGLPGGTN